MNAPLRFTVIALAALPWAFLAAIPAPGTGSSGDSGDFAVLSEGPGGRRIRHPGGVSIVPQKAERIVALAFQDELASLGIRPVGVPATARSDMGDYLAEATAGAAPVSAATETALPDLEAVARCRPDLILAAPADRGTWEQLSRIAPTVILRESGRILKENSKLPALKQRLRDCGRLTGRGEEAERAIRDFDRKLAEARPIAKQRAGDRTLGFLRTFDRDWRLYGRRGDTGGEAIYDALDLRAPANVPEQGVTALDPERLIRLEADFLIIVGDRTPGARQTLQRLQSHPLWARLSAVRRHRVLELQSYRHWVLCGLYGKSRMIDDVLRCLALGDPE